MIIILLQVTYRRKSLKKKKQTGQQAGVEQQRQVMQSELDESVHLLTEEERGGRGRGGRGRGGGGRGRHINEVTQL